MSTHTADRRTDTSDLTRRTHDAFALARKPGKADEARALLADLAVEAGPHWEQIKAKALHRGTFAC